MGELDTRGVDIVGSDQPVSNATTQRQQAAELARRERKWCRRARTASEGVWLVVVTAAAPVLAAVRHYVRLGAAGGSG